MSKGYVKWIAMDKIAETLEGPARCYNSKILYGYLIKLRVSSQSGLS